MTPLEISLLLHIYTRCEEIPNKAAPSVNQAIAQFMGDDLITVAECCEEGSHPYNITTRGKAMVLALTGLPLPVQAWRIPGSDVVIL